MIETNNYIIKFQVNLDIHATFYQKKTSLYIKLKNLMIILISLPHYLFTSTHNEHINVILHASRSIQAR